MELCSEEFLEAVSPGRYGYHPASGLSTDVHTLKARGLSVSCINLSCGYYEPHTDREYTIWEDLCKCYRFVRHIVCCHKSASPHKARTEKTFIHGYYELFGMTGYSEKEYIRFMKKYGMEPPVQNKTGHGNKL